MPLILDVHVCVCAFICIGGMRVCRLPHATKDFFGAQPLVEYEIWTWERFRQKIINLISVSSHFLWITTTFCAIFNSCELNRSTAILVCSSLLFVMVLLPLLLRLYALQRATKSAVSFAPAFSLLVCPIKGWHWHTIDDNNNAVGASIVFVFSQ